MGDLSKRKLDFIYEIVSFIHDEEAFSDLEKIFRDFQLRRLKNGLKRPERIPKKFDTEAIKRERGFKRHDRAKFFRLIREIDVQEPIEDLLSKASK